MNLPAQIIQLIDSKTAWDFDVIPIDLTNNVISFYHAKEKMTDTLQFELELIVGKQVVLKPFTDGEFSQLLRKYYPKQNHAIDIRNKEALMGNLIEEAKALGSSDIHIEPYEKKARIRYRIDGKLIEKFVIKISDYPSLVNKLKIFAHLDIAQKRLPQDGRILFKSEKIKQELRISTIPTLYGEKVVLRLLGNSSDHLSLDKIGMTSHQLTSFKRAINKPNGIVLISGPTGSGKTTTLYTTLKELNNEQTNIMTVEDPIEYTLEGVNQVQLKENINLTFSVALKSFLRQDPDIIMLGEIRDRETAEMAIRAALTGHLVLSTIHTNSAWGTINRLNDMNIPSFLIANTLNISVAQRLIRLLCESCKKPERTNNPEKDLKFGMFPDISFKPYSCEHCNYTGFSGRQAIYETIENNDSTKQCILDNEDELNLSFLKLEDTLPFQAWRLFFDGKTALSEITSLIN